MVVKKIWTAWFQGLEHEKMPRLNRECLSRLKELNEPDWEVNIITDENVGDYAPEYVDIVNSYEHKHNRSYTNKSELLRVILLDKYGGIWSDASVFMMKPVDSFLSDIVNETGFFTFRFIPRSRCRGDGKRETVSWFLCSAGPKHPLITKLKDRIIERYLANKKYLYYTLHDALADLYDEDDEVNRIINDMVQISEGIPHSAAQCWDRRNENAFLYKRPNLMKRLDELYNGEITHEQYNNQLGI